MKDEWMKKERSKMLREGGTTVSKEKRDAESLVASAMRDPTQIYFMVFCLETGEEN
jgi:hypothetical protein